MTAQGPQTLDALFQQRKWPLVGAGLAALFVGLYVSMLVTSYIKSPPTPDPKSPLASSVPTPTPRPSAISGTAPQEDAIPTGRPSTLVTAVAAGCPDEELRQTAEAFDRGLNLPEWLMGLRGLRRELAARAYGHVLEVAVGTGRNMPYYDWTGVIASGGAGEAEARAQRERERLVKLLDQHRWGGSKIDQAQLHQVGVLSFTGVDISADMLGIARTRLRDAVPGLKRIMHRRRLEPLPEQSAAAAAAPEGSLVVDTLGGRVRLVMADAQNTLPLPPALPSSPTPPEKYDTIVQSFGLCSVADPAQLLAHMASLVQPDTGRILLLEHGRGWYDWINHKLDEYAGRHFQRYGCWWNRDIECIVREAAKTVPGLEVVKLERPLLLQAGTTLLVELRVASTKQQQQSPPAERQ